MITPRRAEKIHRVVASRQEGVIILEDIHDPHNAAAVFRSCDAFGFQRICLIFEQEERFNPRKIGKVSSASANHWLDFTIYTSTEACLNDLHKEGYKVFATVLHPEAVTLEICRFTVPKIGLMFGNEHRGLSPKAVAMADQKVMIPMKGMVQSLNLSVTAGIMLYEVTRQREEKGMEKFLLSIDEQRGLEEKFRGK